MALVLGIDCSTLWTCVGCVQGGSLLGEINVNLGRKEASSLPLLVQNLLRSVDKGFLDIDLISVTTGPGYFTGLRVGVSYACALAEGLGVSVVSVSSLEAMAFDLLEEGALVVPVIWARGKYAYAAAYTMKEGEVEAVISPVSLLFDTLEKSVKNVDRSKRIAWVGDDLARFPAPAVGERLLNRHGCRGSSVALIGERRRDLALSPDAVRILYLREPQIGPTKE
jgi:tRNA threonylcarbamoyladenosine biosynthesis protein TsaB